MTIKNKIKIFIIAAIFTILPMATHAATFNITIDKDNLTVGDEFNATIVINSEDTGINAAQATIKFNQDILQVQKVDKAGSIFTFWLAEPAFSNERGEISFVGGSPSGFTGKSLQVIKALLKVKGTGTGTLVFTDSAISASDGSGSNVLTASKGLSIQILTKSELNAIKPPVISREPVAASNAPAKPKVIVPLYPNPENWNNLSSDFSASWNLPGDITGVATSLNKIPDSAPTTGEGLFDNKVFKALPNGIWYLHVRFKNNIGWGATNHYRVAIDTVPPLPFKIEAVDGLSSNNPTPTFKYISSDQFSGIDFYGIRIDNQEEIRTDKTSYTAEPLPPGTHDIVITARDKAQNAAEARVVIDILPIPSPQILFIAKDVFVGEGGLVMSGTAEPNINVLISLKDSTGNLVYQTETKATEGGFWSLSIDIPLKKGTHMIEAISQDSRGALSLPAKSDSIEVRQRPILTIAGIEITYDWFLLGLLIMFSGSFLGGWYVRRLVKVRRGMRIMVAQRDVNSVLINIKNDVEKIMRKRDKGGKTDESIETEVDFLLKKLDDTITKNKGYVLENIQEIE